MEVSTERFVQFLLENKFVLRVGDPFYGTYARGKIVITVDPERPTYDIGFLKESLDRQRTLENSVKDKFFDKLLQYIEETSSADGSH